MVENIQTRISQIYTQRRASKESGQLQYNPKQNGVVEQKNQIIVGEAKAMLYDQALPRYL